jgi:hypothetical protein
MAAINLAETASSCSSQLHKLWDMIGVGDEERASYLAQLTSDVAAIYAARVQNQTDRCSLLEAEIEGLRTTIKDMQVAMEEPIDVVRGFFRAAREPHGCRPPFRGGPTHDALTTHPSPPPRLQTTAALASSSPCPVAAL